MFQALPDSFLSSHLYAEIKFWATLSGFLWTIFKGTNWVQKMLVSIHEGMGTVRTELKEQTTSVVGELRELRSDFRTFYTSPDPLMIPVRARGSRKRATPVRSKTKAKSKAK